MKKKNYSKPLLISEAFVPQEYVAACAYDTSYKGKCDTSGYVFLDSNGNGQYDEKIDEYKYKNTACEHYFESQVEPHYNAFVFESMKNVGQVGDGHWGPVWVGVGNSIPVYNFDNIHANHYLDKSEHHNVS